jgi:SPOR domain
MQPRRCQIRAWPLGVTFAVLFAAALQARDLGGPAELPPADFAGQQYVDSRGCMFVRAGTEGQVLWVPRVSRGGTPLCDTAPSGTRALIEGEVAAPEPSTPTDTARPLQEVAAPDGVFVAVGSFAEDENVTKAERQLAALGYAAVRGRLGGGNLTTVYAGPFASAEAAAKAGQVLRDQGFPDATVIKP